MDLEVIDLLKSIKFVLTLFLIWYLVFELLKYSRYLNTDVLHEPRVLEASLDQRIQILENERRDRIFLEDYNQRKKDEEE